MRLSASEFDALKIRRGGKIRFTDGILITVRARNATPFTISIYKDNAIQWAGVPPGALRDMFVTREWHVFEAVDENSGLSTGPKSKNFTDSDEDVVTWTIRAE